MVMVGVSVEVWLEGFDSSAIFFAAFVEIAVDALLFGALGATGEVVMTLTVDLVLGEQLGGENFGGSIFLDAGVDEADVLDVAVDDWHKGEFFGFAGMAQILVEALVFSVFAAAGGIGFTVVFDEGDDFDGSVVLIAGITSDFDGFIAGGAGGIAVGGGAEHLDRVGIVEFAGVYVRGVNFLVLAVIVGAMYEETVDVAIENRR